MLRGDDTWSCWGGMTPDHAEGGWYLIMLRGDDTWSCWGNQGKIAKDIRKRKIPPHFLNTISPTLEEITLQVNHKQEQSHGILHRSSHFPRGSNSSYTEREREREREREKERDTSTKGNLYTTKPLLSPYLNQSNFIRVPRLDFSSGLQVWSLKTGPLLQTRTSH